MDNKSYQALCSRTIPMHLDPYGRLLHACLGLYQEMNEFADALFGDNPDKTEILHEVGDVMWFHNVMAYHLGIIPAEYEPHNCQSYSDDYLNEELSAITTPIRKAADRNGEVNLPVVEAQINIFSHCFAQLLQDYGFKPEDIAEAKRLNVAKLEKRHNLIKSSP